MGRTDGDCSHRWSFYGHLNGGGGTSGPSGCGRVCRVFPRTLTAVVLLVVVDSHFEHVRSLKTSPMASRSFAVLSLLVPLVFAQSVRFSFLPFSAAHPFVSVQPVHSLRLDQRPLRQLSHRPQRQLRSHSLHDPLHHSPPAVCSWCERRVLRHHRHRSQDTLRGQCVQCLSPEYCHQSAWRFLRRLRSRIDLSAKPIGQDYLRRPLLPRAHQAGHLLQE